jgi:hypothetical protein
MLDNQTLSCEVERTQELEPLDAFVKRLSIVLKRHLHSFHSIDVLNVEEKQLIFDQLWSVCPIQRAIESVITDSHLYEINTEYHRIVTDFRFNYEGEDINLTDYNILASFYNVVYHRINGRKRTKLIKEAFAVPILEGVSMLKFIPRMYAACFSQFITRLNGIEESHYSFEMISERTELGMTLTPVLNYRTKSLFVQANKLSQYIKLKKREEQKLENELRFQDTFNLKIYNLNINTMQEANYDEFLSYIKQGENTELNISNDNREELALQTYSTGKLLQLLVINTAGLFVTLIAKMHYSSLHKLKKMFSQKNDVDVRSKLKERAI